jgi:hypothetical protein
VGDALHDVRPPASCTCAAGSAMSRSASARTPGSSRAVCPRWNTPATSARSRSCGSTPSRSSRELRALATRALTSHSLISLRVIEAAALPSPAVVLSVRLSRYYDRLRRRSG